MEQIKIGFKTFCVTNEPITCEYKCSVATYKNNNYECYRFDNEEDYFYILNRCKDLKKRGILIPKIRAKSKKRLIIVRDLVSGNNCLHLLAKGPISEAIFEKLFTFYRMGRYGKFDLSYLPENYVFDGKKLYYTSFEMIKKNEKYALETYGLYYWIYSKECMNHFKDMNIESNVEKVLGTAEANKNIVLLTIKYW